VTNVQEDSSIKAPIPNIFSSSSNSASSVVITTTIVLGFNYSKHIIKNGIIILASYLNANLITFFHPTKLSTMHKTLKHGCNMITMMLWAYNASKDLKKSKKCLITFITSSHIFQCKSKISTSKGLETSNKLYDCNNSTSMLIVKVITIVKAFNNHWPLDWFSTHAEATRFKANVIASTITHTWALGTLYCKTLIITKNNGILKL